MDTSEPRSDDVVRPLRVELLPAPGAPPAPSPPRYALSFLLFALSFFTTTTLGAGWYLFTRTDVSTDLLPWLTPAVVARVWTDPALLGVGLRFSLPVLFILLCHELGHYAACRRYRLPATLPYFLPAPFGFGTLGAFIRIRAPIRDRRELFDVGFAGPLAGFVALLPFLVYGLAHSRPAVVRLATGPGDYAADLLVPGKNLLIAALVRYFHGSLPHGTVLDLHPFALAAWIGLLATALNLLPLGQLDGGHILYSATGHLQRRLALPLWAGLALVGFYWTGWLVWCVIVLVMGLRHPPVRDEATPLDPLRRAVALLALLMFALCFMPVPLSIVPVG
jgi:membrane-associated protease RseP (regulator of RpoE activity)